MDYHLYDVADFLEDSFFKSWVYDLDGASGVFWEHFLEEHPEKADAVKRARTILLSIEFDVAHEYPSARSVENMWEKIQTGTTEERSFAPRRWGWNMFYYGAAAILIIISGFGAWRNYHHCPITYTEMVSESSENLIEKENQGAVQMDIILPDSSVVTLHPHSKIAFSADYSSKTIREVYLTGMGFFKVRKNPEKPFYVYSGEIVTRVLGTSFLVKAFETDAEIEVNVHSGKVSVATREKIEEGVEMRDPLVLRPNERMLFNRDKGTGHIRKLLSEVPVIVEDEKLSPPQLKFVDARVDDILTSLQNSYGIMIEYDKNLFRSCLLTAEFTNETLFEKIDLICKGIEAEYQIQGTRIVVDGRGCE